MVNAVALPLPGATYGVLPRQLRRRLLYGSQELIAALVAASEYVDAVYPGSVLWLGNIGRRGGGDIPYSVSHNAGRDADIAFYTLDPAGNPVEPPDLLRYGRNGRSHAYGGYYRFDTARNWAMVKALTLSGHAQMQHLFISNGLEALLIDHAERRREPPAIIRRAAELMRQPGAEIPHDDHLHVRTYCSRADVGGGCENTGRVHSGVDLHRDARLARLDQAVGMMRAGAAETRRNAVRRIALLGGVAKLPAIRRRLSDPSPAVRTAAALAIGEIGTEPMVNWLVEHWEEEADGGAREALVVAAGQLGGHNAGTFFADLLQRAAPVTVRGKQYDLRIVALDAIRDAGRAEPAFAMLGLLAEPDGALRARAGLTLREVTNRAVTNADWGALPTDDPELLRARAAWDGWLRSAADETRSEWIYGGFADAGYDVSLGPRETAAVLATACDDARPWIRVNAQRELMGLTGNHPASLSWHPSDARTYWVRWVRRNPGRISRRP